MLIFFQKMMLLIYCLLEIVFSVDKSSLAMDCSI